MKSKVKRGGAVAAQLWKSHYCLNLLTEKSMHVCVYSYVNLLETKLDEENHSVFFNEVQS